MKKCPICKEEVKENPCIGSGAKCTECGKVLDHKSSK